jgi:chromosome segregation ATPase
LAQEREAAHSKEALETELVRAKESLASAEASVGALQAKNARLEDELVEAQAKHSTAFEAELVTLRRRLPELEVTLELERFSAGSELRAAQSAREQAEELLLALRVKYGDLQHEFTTANEALTETRAENELLEHERERLASQLEEVPALRANVERLEARIAAMRGPPPPQEPALQAPERAPTVAGSEIEVFELDGETSEPEELVLLDEATDTKLKPPS